MTDIVLTKNGVTINLIADKVIENFKKNLYKTSRRGEVVVRDRQRITYDIVIQGYLVDTATKTAFQIKDELIDMAKEKGALDSFSWRNHTYNNMFTIERLNFEDSPVSNASVAYNQVKENTVRLRYTIGLVWGESR